MLFFIFVLRFRTLPRLILLLAKGPFFRMMEYGDAGLLGLCLCLLLPATFDTLATLLLCFGGRIAGSSVSRADWSIESNPEMQEISREMVWADYALDFGILHVHVSPCLLA